METVEAVCIGDELLEGRVRDANAALLGRILRERGVVLRGIRVVADEIAAIEAALRSTSADLVIVSGGLGPTNDDRTRDAAAALVGASLALHEPSWAWIRERFETRGYTLSDNNRRQAMIPDSATALATEVGTAPGFELEHDGRTFMFFPGVPSEFEWFVERYVTPRFERPSTWTKRLLQFHGLGESMLETNIDDVVDEVAAVGVTVGYRADYPLIEVSVAGPAGPVADTRDRIVERLAGFLVGEDDRPLPARVGALLLERGETVTTAESCTAGGIAALLTEVSGSSAWFGRGYVTYANEAKMEELGVLESVLLAHGAVSPQTVCQMAAGARDRSRATYALAVSGIAGPGGGTPDKPVGTVHFGIATPMGTFHRHVLFHGDRQRVRAGTATRALAFLLAWLEGRGDHLGHPHDDEAVWSELGIGSEVG